MGKFHSLEMKKQILEEHCSSVKSPTQQLFFSINNYNTLQPFIYF